MYDWSSVNRYSSFSGKISVLEELEKKYALTYGLKTDNFKDLFRHVEILLQTDQLRMVWKSKMKTMLSEKIEVSSFSLVF